MSKQSRRLEKMNQHSFNRAPDTRTTQEKFAELRAKREKAQQIGLNKRVK